MPGVPNNNASTVIVLLFASASLSNVLDTIAGVRVGGVESDDEAVDGRTLVEIVHLDHFGALEAWRVVVGVGDVDADLILDERCAVENAHLHVEAVEALIGVLIVERLYWWD